MRTRGTHNQNWRRGGWATSGIAAKVPTPAKGRLLSTLSVGELAESLEPGNLGPSRISNVTLIGSFNWLESSSHGPTIVVPGKPPQWTPPTRPSKLKEDFGTYYRDKNAARYPQHPMEPAVLAMLHADPQIRSKLDIVACASTMGNLLRFVAENSDKSFRMLVETVDGVMFLIRRENSPLETIPDVRGYGHTFPEAYTTWEPDVSTSETHQRVVGYTFGGLRFAVRAEGDGYLADKKSDKRLATEEGKPAIIEDIANQLAESRAITSGSPVQGDLVVKQAGEAVDQGLVFELKTRSINKRGQDILGEVLPKLWISQASNFILAYHTRGVFNDIEVKDVRNDTKIWEDDHQTELSKLAALLHTIRQKVSRCKDRELEICYHSPGELTFHRHLDGVSEVLSVETKARWAFEKLTEDIELAWADDQDYTACGAECGYCGLCGD